MGTIITDFFDRVYVMIKLSLMFWSMTFFGGVILGVGPALLSTIELYTIHQWDYKEIKWKNMMTIFFSNFKRGNLLFLFYLLVTLIFSYSFYIVVQIKGAISLIVSMILFITIIFVILSYIYSVVLNATFEINFINLVKLSIISVFSDFSRLFQLVFFIILLGFISSRFKGLILFLTPGLFVVISTWKLSDWVHNLIEIMN